MNLFESFSKYQLTRGQEELLKSLKEFLEDSKSCFLLNGYAGTGKTFIMKGFSDYLNLINRPFILAAPTGRAAKVLTEKTNVNANTIHKTIYSNSDIREFKTEDEEGTETFKFYYNLRNNENPANTIYIIDEASMISDVYSEGEFFRFGSGFLLNDLLKYINFDNNDHNKKIIFIGDNAQLPPIGMNYSPALKEQYLTEKYLLTIKSHELTEVARHKKDSGILNNATKLRLSLKNNTFNNIDIETDSNDIKAVNQDFLANYLKACKNQIDDKTIIIAYSNSSVKEYNDFIRSHFFPNKNEVTEGDKVILVSNSYNSEIILMNGEFGIIKAVNPKNETRTILLKKKDKSGNVTETKVQLSFRDVNIQVKDINNNHYIISRKIIENLLHSQNRDLSSEELKALYIDFKNRNRALKSNTKEFKDSLLADKYFNALRVKFGYAITCHKAQGGEWENTFINCKTSMGYLNSSYFRWLYTAITRAKEFLYTIDEPHFKIGDNLKLPKIENFTQRQDLIFLKSKNQDDELLFAYSFSIEQLKHIFYVVFDLIKDNNIIISKIEHKDYHEIYYFKNDEEDGRIKINYKKDYRISLIHAITDNNLTSYLIERLKTIENKLIVIENQDFDFDLNQKDFHFSDDKSHLKLFFEEVKNKVNLLKIEIVEIEHKPFHEVYKFQKGSVVACYKFWYDGQGRFKKTEIISSKTTGLTPELNSLLNLTP